VIEAHISAVAFQLPGSQDRVEIRGQIAWLSESRREAGIRFLDLPEAARGRIQEWISLIDPADAGLHLCAGKSAATTVYELNPLHDPRWETFVRSHPRASVFHSTNWLKALQIAYGYDPAVVTTCPQQAALTNGLVFCRVKSWLTGRRMVSLPFSDHCEPLVNNSGELDDLLLSMRLYVDTGRWKYIEIRPPSHQPGSLTGFGKSLTYCLHRLNLSGSTQELFHNFHKSCVQRKIRKCCRRKTIAYPSCRRFPSSNLPRVLTELQTLLSDGGLPSGGPLFPLGQGEIEIRASRTPEEIARETIA
jgi:hypothetical protein